MSRDDALLYANLAFSGIIGCIIRTGLNSLTGFEYGGILWANVCGCVIMGFHKSFFHESVHVHIGTGLCGSITSFSTLMIQLFAYTTHRKPAWNNSGYSVMAFLSFSFIQFSCSITALKIGRHLGDLCETRHWKLSEARVVSVYLCPLLALIAMIVALVCCILIENGRNWTLMILLSPFGVWVRHYLSRFNRKTLKVGTFSANVAGTLLCAVSSLFLNPYFNTTRLQRDAIHALVDGLAGGLSTISTFVNELTTMPRKAAYPYLGVSLGTGFICALLVMGPVMWVHHSPYL